jgi:hypothetical protein
MTNKYLFTGFIVVLLAACFLPATAQSTDYSIITFAQDDSTQTISNTTDSVILERKPFSILYYGKRYDSKNEKFHALQVAVLKHPADTLMLMVGKNLSGIPYFEPGSGMAPGSNGLYDAFVVTNTGHHYLYYENEAERRVSRISLAYDLLELEWRISGASIDDHDVTLKELDVPALYFVFFNDRNLNEVIDAGELKIVKVKFR